MHFTTSAYSRLEMGFRRALSRLRLTLLLTIVALVIISTSAYVLSQTTSNGQLGTWIQTTSFPLFPSDISCVASSSYIYCVGGYNGTTPTNGRGDLNATYFASLSSTGIGSWNKTTDYPIGIQDESCVASSSYIYCIGGYAAGANTQQAYYASLSKSGIGQWMRTTSYPYPVVPKCMTNAGYIYCVGAHYNGTGYTQTANSYVAAMSSNGIGKWSESSSPSSFTAGCSSSNGYAYCFGGGNCHPPGPCSSPSYFASLSSNQIGAWHTTSELPTAVWANYVLADSFLYYFSDPIYFTHVSSSGMSSWTTADSYYPQGYPASCVSSSSYVYCVGGTNLDMGNVNSTYFSHIQ